MTRHLLRITTSLLLVVAVSACSGRGSLIADVSVNIYRGISAKANGNASLGPGQFVFNNRDMSTFDIAQTTKPCNFRFTVSGLPDPVVVGSTGNVDGLQGYTAAFDNNPASHWNMSPPQGTSDDEAKAEVSEYAQANRQGRVANGSQDNCR